MASWLSREEAKEYKYLTSEALGDALAKIILPCRDRGLAPNSLMAAGVRFAGLPSGLAVVTVGIDLSLGVLSIAVSQDCRRLGIARELMTWIRTEAKELRVSVIWMSYPMEHRYSIAMQRITPPELGWRHRHGLKVVSLDRAGISKLNLRLESVRRRWWTNNRFKIVAWTDITPEVGARLQAAADKMTEWSIASTVNSALDRHDDRLSQVLVYQGEVIGWLIFHRTGISSVRVTQWWISPEWQGRGIALVLVAQATHNALALEPRIESASFGVAVGNHEMLLLCKRMLEPLASKVMNMERAKIGITG